MNQIKTYPEMNEIIKDLLRQSDEPMNLYILARIEELEKQVSDLTPPPNAPLTLEELREMDGEPVWLRGRGLNRWYIFNGFSLDGIPFFTPVIGYGKLWAVYRRKPEEIQHEGLD